MTKTSGEFTKGLGQILSGAKALYDFGVEKGLTTPRELRLTVMARQVEAKKLIASGVSRRQAAKALGVNESTVRADLQGAGKSRKSAGKSRTRSNGREPAPAQEKLVDQIDRENPQNFLTAFLLRVDQATIMAKDAKTLVPSIFNETKPKKDKLIDMLQMSRHAGKLWEEIAEELENRGVQHHG